MDPLLELSGVTAGYGSAIVVEDVALAVEPGQVCALVGANGAGKSTLLATISGLRRAHRGRITFDGTDLSRAAPETVVRHGLGHVAQGRRIFRGMTVRENLDLGLWRSGLGKTEQRDRLDWVLGLFPFLRARMSAQAEVLSGGEQQMLVIGQALMRKPRLLLLDEPSLGLAPVMVDRVFDTIEVLRGEGLSLLLVEQVVERALSIADRGFVMQNGRIVAEGPGPDLLRGPALRQAYLGAFAGGSPSSDPADSTEVRQ
ncbi:ABC transporter ATP-binding protein [Amycolatopsis viridis]|uniref:Branched-chain amino acid transport system ATP-binding protein n=1 Tax=Amycolatopsis viridis TaxID=185678 RepID=A0ABX0T0K4_9PSEU|nr:ABC transporter ATP-binding protein [Amycolatopsis viridis]NIH82756.1 branched-chain amino acid transport system ATP-binding protein [Amycolatopsis viridis]